MSHTNEVNARIDYRRIRSDLPAVTPFGRTFDIAIKRHTLQEKRIRSLRQRTNNPPNLSKEETDRQRRAFQTVTRRTHAQETPTPEDNMTAAIYQIHLAHIWMTNPSQFHKQLSRAETASNLIPQEMRIEPDRWWHAERPYTLPYQVYLGFAVKRRANGKIRDAIGTYKEIYSMAKKHEALVDTPKEKQELKRVQLLCLHGLGLSYISENKEGNNITLTRKKNFETAIKYFKQTETGFTNLAGKSLQQETRMYDLSMVMNAKRDVANTLAKNGRISEAMHTYQQIFDIFAQQSENISPLTRAITYDKYGVVHRFLKPPQLDLALGYVDLGLAVLRETQQTMQSGEHSFWESKMHADRAEVLFDMGKVAQAFEEITIAEVSINTKTLPKEYKELKKAHAKIREKIAQAFEKRYWAE